MGDTSQRIAYDLSANPFIKFNLPLSSSAEGISSAIEDARNISGVPSEIAISAKQALLTPRLRTEAEVECLVDTDFGSWKAILVAARSSQSMSAILKAVEKLGPVSRANVIAHCAARKGSDEAALLEWKKAVDAFDLEALQDRLSKFREEASFVKPNYEVLKNASDSLLDKHAKALLNGFVDSFSASAALTECLEAMFQSSPKISALSILIDNYKSYTQPEYSQLEKEVRACIELIPENTQEKTYLEKLSHAVTAWSHYARPMQLFEALQGRDDGEARNLYFVLRGAMLDQYEKGEISSARRILDLCKKTFIGPRLVERIEADEKDLSSREDFQKVQSLAVMVASLQKDLAAFAKQLERQRFGPTSRSKVGDLFKEFKKAVEETKDSKSSELPWLLLRNLAVEINNDAGNPDASFRLIDGLVLLAQEASLSTDLVNQLKEDLAAADKNKKENKLIERLKSGDKIEALKIVNELLSTGVNVQNRDQLQDLKRQLEQATKVNRGIWIWIALIVTGLVVVAIANSEPNKHNTQRAPTPTTSQQPYSINQSDLSEALPPTGTGNSLTVQQLRYCLFENYRLDYMKNRTKTSRQVQQYNFRIADFNNRCGNFRYRRNDRSVVDRQLESQKLSLQLQSDALLNSWR